MDKYGIYVWASYGVAALVIVAMVLVIWRGLRAAQKTLAELKGNKD